MARPRKPPRTVASSKRYKPDFPKKLLGCMKDGGSYIDFCAHPDVLISKSTFYYWLDTFPELEEAYEQGQVLSQAWWENQARENVYMSGENEKFNATVWSMVMRNRFNLTEHRKVKVPGISKAKTLADKFKLITNLMERGEFTANEAAQLMSFLGGGAKLLESSEMLDKLDKLEKMLGANDVSTSEVAENRAADCTDEND